MTPSNKKSMNNNSNSDESVENINKSELDAIIKDVKIQIRRLFGGYKEQIGRIGNVLKVKGLIKEEDICIEIKNALREEIKEKIISSDTIERCCPDEWKRKTKPKDSIDPPMRISEDKNPQEQETVTNTNTSITSGDQILQQKFEPDDSKIDQKQKEKKFLESVKQEQKQIMREEIIKKQEEELKILRPLAERQKQQESHVGKERENVMTQQTDLPSPERFQHLRVRVTEWQLRKDIESLRSHGLKEGDYLYIVIENDNYVKLELVSH